MVFHVYDIYDYSSLMHCFWPEFKSCAFALWNYISGYNHWPSYEMDTARSLGAGDHPCDTWLNSGSVPDGMKLAKDKADEGGKLVVGHISVDIPQSLIQCHGKKKLLNSLEDRKGSPSQGANPTYSDFAHMCPANWKVEKTTSQHIWAPKMVPRSLAPTKRSHLRIKSTV